MTGQEINQNLISAVCLSLVLVASEANADICKHVDQETGYVRYSVCKKATETRIGQPTPIKHQENYYEPQLNQSDLAERHQKIEAAITKGERQYAAIQNRLAIMGGIADSARIYRYRSQYPIFRNRYLPITPNHW